MITFEEAKELAKKHVPEADTYIEYNGAYLFTIANNESLGGFSPLVVDKETGNCLPFIVALTDDLIEEEIARGQI